MPPGGFHVVAVKFSSHVGARQGLPGMIAHCGDEHVAGRKPVSGMETEASRGGNRKIGTVAFLLDREFGRRLASELSWCELMSQTDPVARQDEDLLGRFRRHRLQSLWEKR